MANYQKVRVKLTNTQWNNLKSASKMKIGTILRMDKMTLKMKNSHINYF